MALRITKWMTWYRMDRNPEALHAFVPRTPYDMDAYNLVNSVNGVAIRTDLHYCKAG